MYDRSKFNRVTIERMLGHLHRVNANAQNIDQNLSELVYITEAEQRKLLEEWNNNTISYPREAIHQLFEEQYIVRLTRWQW